jgi:glycerophosphoryl diester phosphodiesterase
MDLRLSADDKLVVIHDRKVNRTTYDNGAVRRFTAKQLAAMDARRSAPPWPRKRGTGVSTLDRVLEKTPEAKGYYLEVKADSPAVMEKVARLLADRFPTPRESRKVVVMSTERHFHLALRSLAPHIALGLVSLRPDIQKQMDDFDYQHLVLHWSVCRPAIIRQARERKVELAVWNVNDPMAIRGLYLANVDSVITDFPSMAIPLVGSLEKKIEATQEQAQPVNELVRSLMAAYQER